MPRCCVLSEENIWDLLGSAMAEVQEIAQFVWDASEKLHSGTGFHLINEMITRSRDATEEQAALLQAKDQPVFSQR